MKTTYMFLRKNFLEVIGLALTGLFSIWLMNKTFSYSQGSLLIASRVWSDFASHIPLIRSFSFGNNFPPQYPLFPGEPIRYHFLFYALVGLLEKAGLRIDIALNFMSAASFLFLLVMIYHFSKKLFHKKVIGILSVILFLFNGSFSFIYFFMKHPISLSTPYQIINNKEFSSFGPYDGRPVSAFLNLNIYTNQRHLALSFALVLLILFLIQDFQESKNRMLRIFILSCILTLLVFINQAAFAIAMIFFVWNIIINRKNFLFLSIPAIIGISSFYLFTLYSHSGNNSSFYLGYLSWQPFSFNSFFSYWFLNLGLYFFLIPIGYYLSPKRAKALIPPLILLFTIANLFKFSPDIINNHKFINFFIILSGMFIANVIFLLWTQRDFITWYGRKIICMALIFFLTLSGIIDFFVIKNDFFIPIKDISLNKDAQYYFMRTNPQDVILTSTSLYHAASLAGRPIFYGYSYFSWSYGYDTQKREKEVIKIYESRTKKEACTSLLNNSIRYIELNDNPDNYIKPNRNLFNKEFRKIYENKKSGTTLFNVFDTCKTLY